MFGLGMGELIIIGLIVLVLFGAKRVPELGSGLAKGIRNFQKGLAGSADEDTKKNVSHVSIEVNHGGNEKK